MLTKIGLLYVNYNLEKKGKPFQFGQLLIKKIKQVSSVATWLIYHVGKAHHVNVSCV